VTFGDLLEQQIKPLPHVAEIRHLGMMCGIELAGFPPERRTGHLVTLAARLGGAIIRPLGDVIVLMPPLSITEPELAELVQLTASAIADASLEDAPVRLKASLAQDAAGTGASAAEVP